MSYANTKHIKSPVLWITIGFFVLSGLALSLRNTVDEETQNLHQGLIDIKSAVIKIHKMSFLVTNHTNANSSNHNLIELQKFNIEYINVLNNLKANRSKNILIANSFKKVYYDNEFRLDEQFDHINKIINLFLNNVQAIEIQDLKKLTLEINTAKDRVTLFEPLVIKKIHKEILKINKMDSLATYTIFILFLLMISIIYVYVYLPWIGQFDQLQNDKNKLDDILKDSELKAQTYSWELNATDMSIMRSNRLSVLFNGELSSGKILLSDEIKLFSKNSRIHFIEALDIVLEEGKALDIVVEVKNSGRYTYWLHYRGQYDKENNKLTGTVKDITEVKKAKLRFLKLFDSVPHPMIMIIEDNVYRMNEYAYKYFEINDKEKYQNINYSLLFPMYQHDKRASLDKVNELRDLVEVDGRPTSNYVTFQSTTGESITTKTELFKVNLDKGDALILALSGDSMRHNYERRLIEANKRALHERRKKAEYVAHYNTMIIYLTNLLKNNFVGTDENREQFNSKLSSLFLKVESIWQENLAYVVDGKNNILLTNTKDLFTRLGQRWHSAALRHNVEIELELKNSDHYYWMDVEKLKAAMNTLVHAAIKHNVKNKVAIEAYIDDIGSRYGRFHFSLIDTSGKYDFTTLKNHDLTNDDGLFLVREVVEFLQGRLITEEGDINKISFSIDIEKSNRETSSHKEVLRVGEFDDKPHDVVDVSSVFSIEDLLSHFDGDQAILESLLIDFIDYYPVIITDMLMAIREKDGDDLESCASDLYGVISYFPYFKSIERVLLLKKYGQFNKFDRAEEELYALIAELKLFEKLVDSVLLNIKAA
jgi:hypothetical protein